MSAETLKEKMREFAAGKVGSVNVTGADLAPDGQDAKTEDGPKAGTVAADVPKEAKSDPFAEAGAAADIHHDMVPTYTADKIDITEEDRNAFLRALVTGDRYERPFSLFGGRLTGVMRCRSIAESDGIIAWLSHCVNEKKVDLRVNYMTFMRNALLAAQVKSLRGMISEDFPELPTPYGPTRSADGKAVTEPGWVELADSWGKRSEALVTALHSELQRFEQRYWAMIMDANNQNFWSPAASI